MGVNLSSLVKKGGAMIRYLCVVIAALFVPILGAAQCLTTLAPNPPFIPNAQYRTDVPEGGFWYGTDQLWTALGFDGKWSMRDKLVVIAKRLDVEAPSVVVAHANAAFIPSDGRVPTAGTVAPAMMTAIDIPTAGCWEVTVHYRGHTLPFVVSVEPSKP
jgi:hypothetical protein